MRNIKKNIFIMILFLPIMTIGCATLGESKKPDSESRQHYVNTHPDLSFEIKQAILKDKVILSMTKDDVRATWGEPSRIHKYSEHKRAIDESDETINDEAWHYDQPFYSFAPKKFVRFGIDGLVNYVSVDYK